MLRSLGSPLASLLLAGLALPIPAACFGHPGQLEACTFTDPTGCEEPAGSSTMTGLPASMTGTSGTGDTSTTDFTTSTDDAISTGASATGPDGTASSTGEATTADRAPFCGDGIVNQEHEECDDGSPSADGPCSPLCQRERIIFVLSLLLNGKLSGLQGADAYCKSQASKAKKADPSSPIKDANNFKALLPSSTETILERHFPGEGRYRLINGLTVSDSFHQLFSEPLQQAITVTEFGETHVTPVWTASTADGQPYPGVNFCGDWSGVKGSASWGMSESTDAEWIEVSDKVAGQPTTDCASELALYCVEQQ